MQGKNRDADIENRLLDLTWEGKGGVNQESSTDRYTLPYVKQLASGKLLLM